MKDVRLEQIVYRVAEQFHLPKRVMLKLTRHMFNYIFRVMASGKDRVLMFGSPLPQIYTDYDVKKMCHEMIDGKRTTYMRFFKKGNRMNPIHKKHLKRPKFNLLDY